MALNNGHATNREMEYAIVPPVPLLRHWNGKMPATYEIDKPRRLVVTTGSGFLTLADALTHQQKLLKDPDFDPSFSQIMDLTRITEFALEANDIRRIAQTTIFSRESRRAIVASNDLAYGFGRMFEILREIAGENGVRVFRNLDEAIDWILSKNLTA